MMKIKWKTNLRIKLNLASSHSFDAGEGEGYLKFYIIHNWIVWKLKSKEENTFNYVLALFNIPKVPHIKSILYYVINDNELA